MSQQISNDEAREGLIARSRKSFLARATMTEILRSLPHENIQRGLIITPDTGIFSYFLNRSHGNWSTLLLNPAAREEVELLADGPVDVFDGTGFPYDDGAFDILIVVGCLERVEDEEAFIAECHRILEPDGKLVLNVQNRKKAALLTPVRRMLGIEDSMMGWVKPGYTESELFAVLKDGFNVHSMQTYSKFFVQLVNTFIQAGRLKRSPTPDVSVYHENGYGLFVFAYQLDLILLFFTRGYRLVATAKRRAWRPRNTPMLVDGRSISEAVLSKISE